MGTEEGTGGSVPPIARDAGYTLTVADVCRIFNVDKNTVYRWRASGRIKGFKVGRRVYFSQADVEAVTKTYRQPGEARK